MSQFDDAEFAARVRQVLDRTTLADKEALAAQIEAARQQAMQELEAEDREREQRERLAAAAAKYDAELEAARILNIEDVPAKVFIPGARDQRNLDKSCLAHKVRTANSCFWYTAQTEKSAVVAAMHSGRPIHIAQYLIFRDDPAVQRYVGQPTAKAVTTL